MLVRRALFVFACLAFASTALADDKSVCVAAYSSAQDLRAASKLVEAARELRTCASASCPAFISRDCSTWLAEVESSTPTIVLSAKDDGGKDLTSVRVEVDEAPLADHLDGIAVAINPGLHHFVFHFDGATAVTDAVVDAGQKNRVVDVVFARPRVVRPQTRVVTSPLRTWGVVTLVAGAAVLLAGSASGVAAIVEKSDHCVGNTCDVGTLSTLDVEATLSTIGIIGGVVLAGVGVALVLLGKPHTVHMASRGLALSW